MLGDQNNSVLRKAQRSPVKRLVMKGAKENPILGLIRPPMRMPLYMGRLQSELARAEHPVKPAYRAAMLVEANEILSEFNGSLSPRRKIGNPGHSHGVKYLFVERSLEMLLQDVRRQFRHEVRSHLKE